MSSPWHKKYQNKPKHKIDRYGSAIFSFLTSVLNIESHSGRFSKILTLIMLLSLVSGERVFGIHCNKVRVSSMTPRTEPTLAGQVQLSHHSRLNVAFFLRRLSCSELSKLSVSPAAYHYSACGLMLPDIRYDPRC